MKRRKLLGMAGAGSLALLTQPASADSTADIQAQIDAGPGVVTLGPGTFDVDGLVLRAGVTLTGAGTGVTFLRQVSDAGGHHMLFPEGGDNAVRNITFTGIGGPSGNTYGVAAGNRGPLRRLRVEDCHFTGFSGGGVQYGAPDGLVSDSYIRTCSFLNCGVNIAQPSGIAMTNATRILLDTVWIEHDGADRSFINANGGIDLEPNMDADILQDIEIRDAMIRNAGGYGMWVTSRQSALDQTRNIRIVGGSYSGNAYDGIILYFSRMVQTIGAQIRDNGRYGWRSFGPNNSLTGSQVLDNNRIGAASGHTSLENVTGCVVSGNRIGYALYAGFTGIPQVAGNTFGNLVTGNL